MKRLICLLLILCLAVSLCACGSSSNNLSFFLKEPPMEAVEKKFGNNYSDYSPRNKSYKMWVDSSVDIYTLLYEDITFLGYKGDYLFIDYLKRDNNTEYDRKDAPFIGMCYKIDYFSFNNDEKREQAVKALVDNFTKNYGEYSEKNGTYRWSTNDGFNIVFTTSVNNMVITVSKISNYETL